MTNTRIQHGFQTSQLHKRGAVAAKKKRSKAGLLLLLVLPVFMIMMMLVGAVMPGSKAESNVKTREGTGSGMDDTPVTRSESLYTTSDTDDVAVNSSVLGATELIPTNDKKETSKLYTDRDVEVVAKAVYGEALVTHSDMEMASVVWCILNRVDSTGYACGGTIEEVTTFPDQFHGYNEDHPVPEHIEQLVIDVFERWTAEKNGEKDVGRVLPKEYIYFWGDGNHNYFTTEFLGGDIWEWEAENPYEN